MTTRSDGPRPEGDDARERAKELQMEATLTELGGLAPASSLTDRILAGLRGDAPTAGRARSSARAPSRWLVAAFVLAGAGVVGGIAWLQGDGAGDRHAVVTPEEGEQDPQKQDPKPAPPPKQAYTIIADYSDSRIVEVNQKGQTVFVLEDVFGAWDADVLDNGNLLIVEFSISRVRELDRKGKEVWSFGGNGNLKNPYSAQRLANGNTLIADTFGARVIEVDRAGDVTWEYSADAIAGAPTVRPFDAERLPNGNTLIADVVGDRALEVDEAGKIVWQRRDLPNAHDVDRLPNGNTLVTLRNLGKVVEVDKVGEIVWELDGLHSPSDADRLPNGNTLVAENARVREFDPNGKVVWKKAMTWAVEANRYVR